jgi:putative membrane protein
MRNFKRVLVCLLLFVVGLLVVCFVLENRQPVSLFLLGWSAPELPLSVFLVVALLVGLVLGPVFVWIRGFRK